jgi:hypothetical protein
MFTLLAGGCVCAYFAAISCEFFSYSDHKDATQLPEPYLNVTSATVGLFGYFDEADADGSCTNYEASFDMDDDDFSAYFITAQFAAIIGPSCAALAWLLNGVEWLWWSNQCTYVLVICLLMLAFSVQGLTFMIYGQKEFWYVLPSWLWLAVVYY